MSVIRMETWEGRTTDQKKSTFLSAVIMTIEIKLYKPSDEESVVQLWTDCGLVVPWNNPQRDIRRKLEVQSELFLVGFSAGHIIASVMAGYDGHRGWINYLAVHPDHQQTGIGGRMVEEVEIRLLAIGCPKINLQVRKRSPAPNLICFRPLNVQKYSFETSSAHIRHW